jgi:superfamily II DNA or RNA helicase
MTGLLMRPAAGAPPHALLRVVDDFGVAAVDLLRPPGRFWLPEQCPPAAELNVDVRRTLPVATPASLLENVPPGEAWPGFSKRSVARLFAWYLVAEDPQRRLEQREIAALAHQASLVSHVLQDPRLNRVMIADEVGLGKTVEAGLILRELLGSQPGLRCLYLSPARLATNVRRELDRLGLGFRLWVAGGERDAKLDDPRVIASIHRAAIDPHFKDFTEGRTWDVVVVDECHHLSDWAKGGGSPVRKYQLVKKIVQQLGAGSRLILMSGTPHQGHPDRFRNLLALLQDEGESKDALAGRVIYRTKDDVRGWDGKPLFPGRIVNPPIVIDLGTGYRHWLTGIHDFYATGDRANAQRAAGWRAGQALQWATSSPEAGVGYLVRQALRAKWDGTEPELREALAAIRPYRSGTPDESLDVLLGRIRKEIQRQQTVADVEDIEESDEEGPGWRPDPRKLAALLQEGVALLASQRHAKWDRLYDSVIREAGAEKVVLFAQPIETVTAVARYLETRTGHPPAVIVGGQEEWEREEAIRSFWRADGPQFLVSSRAGGEGINLQIARRLVHLDVPWNPMELEQRVGRVHRFMSRRTILVDTLVVKDSRETDAYRIARQKLEGIASVLASDEYFDALFARVMSLVPPEELLSILGHRPVAPLNEAEQAQIAALVQTGLKRWKQFHEEYSEGRASLKALNPGLATWDDVARFATDHLQAKPIGGYSALTFRWEAGEIVAQDQGATVLAIDGHPYACGDFGGMPVSGPAGEPAPILGLNRPELIERLRGLALPDGECGAAHLRWPAGVELPLPSLGPAFGLLVLARQSARIEQGSYIERSFTLHWRIVTTDGQVLRMEGEVVPRILRALLGAPLRRSPDIPSGLLESIHRSEREVAQALRAPDDDDRRTRTVHAVTPLFAAIVSRA